MLKIRLQRVGRKHEPAFRLVLTDSKNSTKSGRFKEILGSYDPRKTVDAFKADRIKHWLSVGALPTDTVHNLLINHKIIEGKKINVLPKKTPPVKEAVAPTPEEVGVPTSDQSDQSVGKENKAEETKAEEPQAKAAPAPAEETPKEEVDESLKEEQAPASEAKE